MKKIIFICCTALFIVSCNNNGEKDIKPADETKMTDTKVADTKIDFAYTLDKPYRNWQVGDQQNAANVLKGLKAWENADMEATIIPFADSVELTFDYFHAKLSKDSLKKFFTQDRANFTAVKITVYDWLPVISGDKKEEWVTMWYKQVTTDKKGKTDSMNCVDDAKIVNGKIVELDGKVQHFPAAKK